MDFFNKIPVMDRTALRELKKGIDFSFKEFSRAYGDGIESFFDPLLYFLIWLEKLLVNSPWPIVIGVFALLAWFGSRSIKLVIGTVVVYVFGAYLMLAHEQVKRVNVNRAFYPKAIFGLMSGFISAPMGITGAMMNVPLLRYLGYPISKCIGSAATIGLFISLTGSVGFLISGFYFNANLPFSIGFVNIPAFLLFVPITTFMARFGANTVYKMNKIKAQRLFGVFLYAVGTIFIYRYFNI